MTNQALIQKYENLYESEDTCHLLFDLGLGLARRISNPVAPWEDCQGRYHTGGIYAAAHDPIVYPFNENLIPDLIRIREVILYLKKRPQTVKVKADLQEIRRKATKGWDLEFFVSETLNYIDKHVKL